LLKPWLFKHFHYAKMDAVLDAKVSEEFGRKKK